MLLYCSYDLPKKNRLNAEFNICKYRADSTILSYTIFNLVFWFELKPMI